MTIRFISDSDYSWMSNFAPIPIQDSEGKTWPTVEHLFQAAKSLNRSEQDMIRKAPSPKMAKKLGRAVKLRKGWDNMRLNVMKGILKRKFEQHPDLKEKLLATGNEPIEEDAHWDEFWGTGKFGHGKNWMGKLLMQLRGEFRSS